MSNENIPQASVIGNPISNGDVDPEDARILTSSILSRKLDGGRYLFKTELARGGMGQILTIYDQDLRRISAMKVIAPNLLSQEQKLLAFIEEARLTAHLEHPNIIPVHEIGMDKHSGCPYYTTKLIEGESLNHIIYQISEGNRKYIVDYPRHTLLNIFRKVCDAVAYAHSRGIIHRDIKPENIMVGQFGEVVLMDWGLAKLVDDEDGGKSQSDEIINNLRDPDLKYNQTMDGVIKGSLAYLSPEQAYGDLEGIDKQSDIFLLGGTLYHMLTGYPPYYGTDLDKLLEKAERCDFTPPSVKNPGAQIPLALERIVLKAMAPVKKNRYQSVNDFISELDGFLSGKRSCGRRLFSPGEKLIKAGDFSSDSYVIIDGTVEVSRKIGDKDYVVGELGHGDIIGELAGITFQVRSATITAKTATEVLVITHDLLMEELEKLPPWLEKIIFSMAERIRTLDNKTHPLMLKNPAFPVVNQLYYIFCSIKNNEYGTQISLNKRRIADEIHITTGISRPQIRDVIEILVQHKVLYDDNGALDVANHNELSLFVDYIRYQFDIQGGIKKIDKIKIPPDLNSYFRKIVRDLKVVYDEIPTQQPGDEEPATSSPGQ